MNLDQIPTIYYDECCPYSQRVLIGLKEANIPYEKSTINIVEGKPEWYLKTVNPKGKVPTVKVGNEVMTESLPLLEYMNDLGGEPLYPKDALDRYKVRFFADFYASQVEPANTKLLFTADPEKRKVLEEELIEKLKELNKLLLAQSPSGYFLGEQFSMAEAATAPFALRMGESQKMYNDFTIPRIPELERFFNWVEALEKRDSVMSTFAGWVKLKEFFDWRVSRLRK